MTTLKNFATLILVAVIALNTGMFYAWSLDRAKIETLESRIATMRECATLLKQDLGLDTDNPGRETLNDLYGENAQLDDVIDNINETLSDIETL